MKDNDLWKNIVNEVNKVYMNSIKFKEENPEPLNWWKNLSQSEKEKEIYHYCMCEQISSMEFDIKDIKKIYNQKCQFK